ncbi:MAG: protein translocase subunit SecF, partial [Elusimicrobia bacterium]|nr:protein translocase subunit SecF [Elusimicrobiota bacterium]
MLQIIPKTTIDFVGKRYVFFAISGLLIGAGIASLILKGGPKWGLDFTGGTLVEIRFQNPPAVDEVRNALISKGISSFELQSVGGEGTFMVRAKPQGGGDVGKEVQSALEGSFPDRAPSLLRKEYVGPTVGSHLIRQTFWAFMLTFVGIIIYVAFRFHSGIWGASGVIALVHDVLATVGIFSITNKEIDVTIVAALLTIAGYSINDTIVVFDYMREQFRLRRTESYAEVINRSINETLSRTIITNLTVFFVVLALYFFGGEVIHNFAFAMTFGAVVGTYSTIAVAAPLIYEWQE